MGRIEPGCTCVVVYGEGTGEEVIVREWYCANKRLYGVWAMENEGWLVDFDEDNFGVYDAAALMRIDDYKPEEQDEEEKILEEV